MSKQEIYADQEIIKTEVVTYIHNRSQLVSSIGGQKQLNIRPIHNNCNQLLALMVHCSLLVSFFTSLVSLVQLLRFAMHALYVKGYCLCEIQHVGNRIIIIHHCHKFRCSVSYLASKKLTFILAWMTTFLSLDGMKVHVRSSTVAELIWNSSWSEVKISSSFLRSSFNFVKQAIYLVGLSICRTYVCQQSQATADVVLQQGVLPGFS